MTLAQLAQRWRADADLLERYGDKRGADLLRRCADDHDQTIADRDDEVLTVDEASRECGLSTDRLRKRLSENGDLPNAGRRGAPRVRRGDLPRKASRLDHDDEIDDFARRALTRRK